MSIPQFQKFMQPALNALKDGSSKHISNIEKLILPILNLTEEDCKQTVSGNRTLVRSRLYWALYFMYRAGLISKPAKATYLITDLGLQALSSGEKIDVKFLEKFSSFKKFQNLSRTEDKKQNIDIPNEEDVDPTTRISNAIEDFNNRTKQELLEQLKKTDPVYFEKICLELMKAMGYGDEVSLTARSHDGGIDGIVNEDSLGLDKIYLQAKRYSENKVNEKEMQNFIGALSTSPVNKGVFITTSEFSEKARLKASQVLGKVIKLIDGDYLTELMLKYNVGVQVKETYYIKELDWAFFSDDE